MRVPGAPQASAKLAKSTGCRSTPYSGLPRNEHLLPLDQARACCSSSRRPSPAAGIGPASRISPIIMVKPSIADEGDDLASGKAARRADRVGQAAAIIEHIVPLRGELLARRELHVARGPGGDRAGIAADDRVVGEELPTGLASRPAGRIGIWSERVPRSSISSRQAPCRTAPAAESSGRRCGRGVGQERAQHACASPTRPISAG